MDVFGKALSDYFNSLHTAPLLLHNSYDVTEEMPVEIFFRNEEELPLLEKVALKACRGRVLDIGAGTGSHALMLQKQGIDVTTLDNSKAAIQIMQHRGIKKVIHSDFFAFLKASDFTSETFDTLVFLMNGIGITGTLPAFQDFLSKADRLLQPGGQLLFDSSDIRYLYDGLPLPANQYYGEVSYQYEYQNQKGNWFNWLYIDPDTLKGIAAQTGWQYEMLFDDEEDQFLYKLIKR